MTVRNLDALFRPTSVAVIGASMRPRSIGAMVWSRVIEGGFTGPVYPVNPKHHAIDGHTAYADAGDLPDTPCVALICTPPATWPAIVHRLGGMGTRAAIIIGEVRTDDDRTHLRHALAAARPNLLRIVGPGSLGVVTPALNAHLGAPSRMVKAGGVAWVSQSNALTNAVLGWAHARGLGFSHAVALGGEADVDAGDVLDYLASDPATRAILLELDTVRAARKFMSAARAAARNKPVLALRAGRADPANELYTAAFRRAGMVRVDSLDDLLDEIETLGVGRVAASDVATLITGDSGVATLACDAFAAAGDTLAQWPPEAAQALAVALPQAFTCEVPRGLPARDDTESPAHRPSFTADAAQASAETAPPTTPADPPTSTAAADAASSIDAPSHAPAHHPPFDADAAQKPAETVPHATASPLPNNPLILGDDARPEHFGAALQALAPHRATGTAFVVHAPTHSAPVAEVAQALIANQRFAYRGLLACFFGCADQATRDALHAHGIPVHTTPQRLARAFARLVDYRLGRELLMQTPEVLSMHAPEQIDAAQKYACAALAAAQSACDPAAARSSDAADYTASREADRAANLPPTGSAPRHAGHFSIIHGAQPSASHPADASTRPAQIVLNTPAAAPLLAHFGLTVATHVSTVDDDADPNHVVDISIELYDDDDFGPVFRFTTPSADGISPPQQGYGLPPLNPVLARDIVARSPYARRAPPEPTLAAFTALSQAVCEVREIVGMALTLRVLTDRVVVIAPRVTLSARRSRLAIVPYPRRYEETIDWQGTRLTVRPIRPEDEASHREFVEAMTPDDLRLRFFSAVGRFEHSQLARMTQIDYDREMALIATVPRDDGSSQTLGVVRAIADPDNETAEFAVAIRSDQKGRRLGRLLMDRIIAYARGRGTHWLVGEALRENSAMIGLARHCGFTVSPTEDPGVVGFRMALEK